MPAMPTPLKDSLSGASFLITSRACPPPTISPNTFSNSSPTCLNVRRIASSFRSSSVYRLLHTPAPTPISSRMLVAPSSSSTSRFWNSAFYG